MNILNKQLRSFFFLLTFSYGPVAHAQDTFSIVAVDSVTGEVGSAGASCVDLFLFFPNSPIDFLGDLIPGQAAINTQASYNATNQANARQRMLAGDTPLQAINWLVANDVNNTPNVRQYGIAALVNGTPQAAGYTGAGTFNYKNHIAGSNYCIQGNILSGQAILDSMEARFLAEPGDLACKLMAAMQGANVPGADTRCAGNGSGTSSLFAFLKVAQPGDPIGQPSFLLTVKTAGGLGIEPIDSLQILFDAQRSCGISSAVSEARRTPWKIAPNPTTATIQVHWESDMLKSNTVRYRLFDITGRIVMQGQLTVPDSRMDISGIPAGIYQLEIDAGGQRYREQLVKQ